MPLSFLIERCEMSLSETKTPERSEMRSTFRETLIKFAKGEYRNFFMIFNRKH